MSSSPGIRRREHVDMMYISIETAIALASVVGNVVVVLAVCVNRALRNTTFCFIVSLAVADIAVGVLVIPLAIIISLGFKTQFYTCLFLSCLLLIDQVKPQRSRTPQKIIVFGRMLVNMKAQYLYI